MNRPTKHSASFFLAVFTAYLISGLALGGLSYYAATSPQAQKWTASCNHAALQIHKTNANANVNTLSSKNLPQHKNARAIPCHSSLQILPALATSLEKPNNQNSTIFLENGSTHSQLFVYQEPDPPRFLS